MRLNAARERISRQLRKDLRRGDPLAMHRAHEAIKELSDADREKLVAAYEAQLKAKAAK